jgi:hypothetical protein
MDVERIRELVRASPFRPFNLVLLDGRKLPVDAPYFLGISPDGRLMSHSSLDGGFERLVPQRVADVDFQVDRGLLLARHWTHPKQRAT